MKNTVVIGAQWGDEGKAKITDLLAEKADIIIRYQGGCNAGHTVVTNGETYKFHLIPSGILYGDKICFIGAGTVIHPESFEKEISELKSQGVNLKGLKISPLASITLPYHIEMDGWSENNSGKGKIGTTKRGIGPTYTDKAARCVLKIQDLYSFEALNEKLDIILPLKNKILEKVYGIEPYTKECIISLCEKYAELFRPYVCFEWQDLLNRYKDRKILFEDTKEKYAKLEEMLIKLFTTEMQFQLALNKDGYMLFLALLEIYLNNPDYAEYREDLLKVKYNIIFHC